MRVKFIRRCLVVALVLMLIAVVTNLSVQLWNPWPRLKLDYFWPATVLNAAVMLGYAYAITHLYDTLIAGPTQQNDGRGSAYVAYVCCSFLAVGCCQALLAHTALWIVVKKVYISWGYFRADFPYFAVPLFAYIFLVPRYPALRFRLSPPAAVPPAAAPPIFSSHVQPPVLLKYLRSVIPARVAADGPLRFFDVVCIAVESKLLFAYLTTGEKVLLSIKSSDIAKWSVAPWFLKARKDFYVNMLYVRKFTPNMKCLELDELAWQSICAHGYTRKLMEGLEVSRRMRSKYLIPFLERMDSLPLEGWESEVPAAESKRSAKLQDTV